MDRLTPRPKITAGLIAGLLAWLALQLGIDLPGPVAEATAAAVFAIAAWAWPDAPLDARHQLYTAGADPDHIDVDRHEHDLTPAADA